MNNFIQRILTGTVFIGVILASIWWGPFYFQLLFLLVAILALNEFFRLTTTEDDQPNRIAGVVAGTLCYVLISFTASGDLPVKLLTLILPVLVLLFFAELYRKKKFPFRNISLTVTGIIYTTVPLALLTNIAYTDFLYSRALLMGYFILLWSSDSFAYVHGNLFGKTRLFERISPKKSWEGSILGGMTTLGVAWAFAVFNPEIPLIQWMIMAVLICITGTLGDLTESLLKRSLGVKDSGNLLPGHGGILDRFDALFLSVPFVWAFFQIIS